MTVSPDELAEALKTEILERERKRVASPASTLSSPLGVTCGSGFYQDEGGPRWMGKEAHLYVWRQYLRPPRSLSFRLTCGQAGYYAPFPFRVSIYVGGLLADSLDFIEGEQSHTVRLALPAAEGDICIRLTSQSTFTPVHLWMNDDRRELSVRLSDLVWEGGSEAEPAAEDVVEWQCNVCGGKQRTRLTALGREAPSCPDCGSTVRFRSIVHLLSMELFGASLPLANFPRRRHLRGAGMSDWEGYASRLKARLDYTNTFFDRLPRLDITEIDPRMANSLDFLICSDVFEHVAPPVSRAFTNLRRLLKPNGVLIFTVPYGLQEETLEHFPSLHTYRLVKQEGRTVLESTTIDGQTECFTNLVFHGGVGATLEMRVFSERSLLREFTRSGFRQPKIWDSDYLPFGIHWQYGWGLPMTVRPS